MQPTELPARTATGPAQDAEVDARTLRDEVVELARALPGDLRRLTVRSGSCEIEVEWAAEVTAPATGGQPASRPLAAAPDPDGGRPGAGTEVPEGTSTVRAPLVGTFYVAASPDADPFVQVGDSVEVGQTLGIVEAMKLMNPIVADEAGVITEVLVGDAESVEYDQVLMHLRPAGRSR